MEVSPFLMHCISPLRDRIMNTGAVLLVLSVASAASLAVRPAVPVRFVPCKNSIKCPCGEGEMNITVCLHENSTNDNLCRKWARCKTCQDGLDGCVECPKGFEGVSCDVPALQRSTVDRQERLQYFPTKQWQNVTVREKRQTENIARTIMCPDPGVVAHGRRFNGDLSPSYNKQWYRPGQTVQYMCYREFTLLGQSVITCLDSGSWSHRPPSCRSLEPTTTTTASSKSCDDPGFIANGHRRLLHQQELRRADPEKFEPGEALVFGCRSPGFDLSARFGSEILTCRDNGTWSGPLPTCIDRNMPSRVTCSHPGRVDNADELTADGAPLNDRGIYRVGQSVGYICHTGFMLQHKSVITCLGTYMSNNLPWSSGPPICKKLNITVLEEFSDIAFCENPSPITNIRIEILPPVGSTTSLDPGDLDFPEGTRLQFRCVGDLRLEGSSSVICEDSGFWSADPPTCQEESERITFSCESPDPIVNGIIRSFPPAGGEQRSGDSQDISYPAGTWLEYTCEDGYTLKGSAAVLCEQNGMWSSEAPSCTADCGRSSREASRKIGNGNATLTGEWPWVVAIAIQEGTGYLIQCGGVLLNSRTVLTAAHCLSNARSFRLYFGKYHYWDRDDDSEVEQRLSQRVIIHPNFNSSTYDSDIGLVSFAPRVHFSDRIRPICLPSADTTAKNIRSKRKGYVTGWGTTERNLPSSELLVAYLPVLTSSECMQSYRSQNVEIPVTQNMFCAGSETGLQSGCKGDSGSPFVFYNRQTQEHTLEGLVSFGTKRQCGLPGRYTVFTKVFNFLPWILQNLQ